MAFSTGSHNALPYHKPDEKVSPDLGGQTAAYLVVHLAGKNYRQISTYLKMSTMEISWTDSKKLYIPEKKVQLHTNTAQDKVQTLLAPPLLCMRAY